MNQTNDEKFLEKVQVILDIVIFISLTAAIFIVFFGDLFVNIVYGEAYRETSDILAIHIFAGVSVSFSYVWSKILVSENKQKIILNANFIGSLINVILNYFLIKEFGVAGAAWATLISYICADFYVVMIYKKKALIFMLLKCFDISRLWRTFA